MTANIQYDISELQDPQELLDFYNRQQHSTTQSLDKLKEMIDATFCFVTARKDGELIGIARGITDGVRAQLVECKLDPAYQGPACVTHTDGRIEHDRAGIAREMALRVLDSFRQSGVEKVHVLAYGTEVDFCEDLGFKRMPGLVALELDPAKMPGPPAGPPAGQAPAGP